MADKRSAGNQLEQWISIGATIAAPVTVLGALLFYFGYVSSASEYAYFGINVDTIGLSTQDYIIRSPQTLLAPLLVLTLVSAALLALNSVIRRRIESACNYVPDAVEPWANSVQHIRRIRHITGLWRIPGVVALIAGIVLLFAFSYIRDWELYGLVTPLLIGIGAATIAYTSRILDFLRRLQTQHERTTVKESGATLTTSTETDRMVLARRTTGVLLCVIIATSVFWATATIAQWSGRGLAEYAATHFDTLPNVILDSKERLWLVGDQGVTENTIPWSEGQTFHYRYQGLRLLIEGQDRMFLVPDDWSTSDSTLVVPLDGSVRVQFQFQSQIP